MIKILSADTGGKSKINGRQKPSIGKPSVLSCLGVRRLVLQPMDARLEYMRDLRVWLRESGWKITQVGHRMCRWFTESDLRVITKYLSS